MAAPPSIDPFSVAMAVFASSWSTFGRGGLILLPDLHQPVNQDGPHRVRDVRLLAHVVVLGHELHLRLSEIVVDVLRILRGREDVHNLWLVLTQGRHPPLRLDDLGLRLGAAVHLHVARVGVGEPTHSLGAADLATTGLGLETPAFSSQKMEKALFSGCLEALRGCLLAVTFWLISPRTALVPRVGATCPLPGAGRAWRFS